MYRQIAAAALAAATVVGVSAGTANAAMLVTTGVDNSGTSNVLANGCSGALVQGPALTVQGCLNTDHAFVVNFTSDENISYSGGQATITAQDGEFSYLKVWLADPTKTFNKLLLNIDAKDNGSVVFEGSPGSVSNPFALDKNGQNKFIITGEDFAWISFVTNVGVNLNFDTVSDVKQVRIGGIPGVPDDDDLTPVPEPTSMLLLGSGLAMVASRLRRRA